MQKTIPGCFFQQIILHLKLPTEMRRTPRQKQIIQVFFPNWHFYGARPHERSQKIPESRRLRTVKKARLTSRIIWILVTAECALFQMDDLLKASSTSAPTHSPCVLLFHFSSTAAALLRSLSYFLGILLRIVNVYIYYKIFFSMSNRSTLKTK
ncbi:uncharacterized protein LOC142415073 isoform X3 [Mycteria americana]|uniref:uncharacterized protein LOC142415073 isoform X3 n=1 Tax=Mycteria americana TaxID=33587 RepID=UPI003F58FC26